MRVCIISTHTYTHTCYKGIRGRPAALCSITSQLPALSLGWKAVSLCAPLLRSWMKSHRDVSIWKTVSGLVFSFLLLTPSLHGVSGEFCSGSQILWQQSQGKALGGKGSELARFCLVPVSEEGKARGGGLSWGSYAECTGQPGLSKWTESSLAGFCGQRPWLSGIRSHACPMA